MVVCTNANPSARNKAGTAAHDIVVTYFKPYPRSSFRPDTLPPQVLAKPDLTSKPGASNLLMRFLSIPEGIQYLEELGCVEGMVREWKESGLTTSYAASVDATWKVTPIQTHFAHWLDPTPSCRNTLVICLVCIYVYEAYCCNAKHMLVSSRHT